MFQGILLVFVTVRVRRRLLVTKYGRYIVHDVEVAQSVSRRGNSVGKHDDIRDNNNIVCIPLKIVELSHEKAIGIWGSN